MKGITLKFFMFCCGLNCMQNMYLCLFFRYPTYAMPFSIARFPNKVLLKTLSTEWGATWWFLRGNFFYVVFDLSFICFHTLASRWYVACFIWCCTIFCFRKFVPTVIILKFVFKRWVAMVGISVLETSSEMSGMLSIIVPNGFQFKTLYLERTVYIYVAV